MLPRINVVLPDEQRQRRSSSTGTSLSELRRSLSTIDGDDRQEEQVTLHDPTTQEMLQYELMQLIMHPNYMPDLALIWRSGAHREFALLALKHHPYNASWLANEFNHDKDFWMDLVKLNPEAWSFAPQEFQDDVRAAAAS